MDKPIMFTPQDIWNLMLAICGGIVAVAAAVGVVIRIIDHFKRPDKVQDARIESLETDVKDIKARLQEGNRHFADYDEQMKALETSIKKSNTIVVETLNLLLEHEIEGNNIEGMKEQRRKIDKYLLER